MTALEKIRICAEAMEMPNVKAHAHRVTYRYFWDADERTYDPIHFDHQAMALKKTFKLSDSAHHNDIDGTDWIVTHKFGAESMSHELNEAIVDCVVQIVTQKKQAA